MVISHIVISYNYMRRVSKMRYISPRDQEQTFDFAHNFTSTTAYECGAVENMPKSDVVWKELEGE